MNINYKEEYMKTKTKSKKQFVNNTKNIIGWANMNNKSNVQKAQQKNFQRRGMR